MNFFIELEYENIPDFCLLCNTVDRSFEARKRRKVDDISHNDNYKKRLKK